MSASFEKSEASAPDQNRAHKVVGPSSLGRASGVALIGLVCFSAGSIANWLALRGLDQKNSLRPLEGKIENLSSAVEGRLDNLNRAVLDLRTALSKPPVIPNGPPASGPKPTEPIVSVSDLLRQAEEQRVNKNLRGAEILLTRAIQTNRDDLSACARSQMYSARCALRR